MILLRFTSTVVHTRRRSLFILTRCFCSRLEESGMQPVFPSNGMISRQSPCIRVSFEELYKYLHLNLPLFFLLCSIYSDKSLFASLSHLHKDHRLF